MSAIRIVTIRILRRDTELLQVQIQLSEKVCPGSGVFLCSTELPQLKIATYQKDSVPRTLTKSQLRKMYDLPADEASPNLSQCNITVIFALTYCGATLETPTKYDVFALTRMNIYMLPKQVIRKHYNAVPFDVGKVGR